MQSSTLHAPTIWYPRSEQSDSTRGTISFSPGRDRRYAAMCAPQSLHIAVDDEWNITFTTQDEWMLVAKPVAQALGWITHENKVQQSALFGLKIYSTLDQTPTYGYEWCALPLRYSFTFPGTFLIPLTVSLCRCTHKVVQVQTNLIEPRQVGEEQLHLLHEMECLETQ